MATPPATPSPTPTDEQLIAFAAGNLPAEHIPAVSRHVQSNAQAAATVAAYQAVRQTLLSDDSVAPPHEVVARAQALFRSRALAAASQPTVLATWMQAVDRLIARIVYDSRLQPAAVRFADAGDRINLTFETERGEVDVQAERLPDNDARGVMAEVGGGRWRIMGQISDDASTGRELALLDRASSTTIAQIVSDDHGAFVLEAPGGAYELLLRTGDRAIVLAPIDLK